MTGSDAARFVVLEHHTPVQVREAAGLLAGDTGSPVLGWRPVRTDPSRPRTVCVGRVTGRQDAAAAVLAAVDGADLVIDVTGGRP